jgi:hypothetical protein
MSDFFTIPVDAKLLSKKTAGSDDPAADGVYA